MDENSFMMNGREHRLSRRQLVERMSGEKPEPLQKWAALVGDKWFPVKQVLACGTGVGRSDFTSHRARDVLQGLGIRVVDLEAEGGLPPVAEVPPGGEHSKGSQNDAVRLRLAVLPLAVQIALVRPEPKLADVLETAGALEAWVTR